MARNAIRFKDEGISLEKIINSIQYRFARCKELLDIVFIANRKEDMSVRKIVSRVYLAPIHHILTCSVVQMEVLGKKIILQHGRKFYNSYGSILYADFAARKGGSLEALELEGMVNAIFYAMNNKGCSISMYTSR